MYCSLKGVHIEAFNMHCRATAQHIEWKVSYYISYCPRCGIFQNAKIDYLKQQLMAYKDTLTYLLSISPRAVLACKPCACFPKTKAYNHLTDMNRVTAKMRTYFEMRTDGLGFEESKPAISFTRRNLRVVYQNSKTEKMINVFLIGNRRPRFWGNQTSN